MRGIVGDNIQQLYQQLPGQAFQSLIALPTERSIHHPSRLLSNLDSGPHLLPMAPLKRELALLLHS